MTFAPEGPRWLSSPCPSWCVRDHLEEDHPDDRAHQSHAAVISAMTSAPTPDGHHRPVNRDLVVLASQHVDDDEIWVRIEAAEHPSPRLVCTLPSMRELTNTMKRLLEAVSDQPSS